MKLLIETLSVTSSAGGEERLFVCGIIAGSN